METNNEKMTFEGALARLEEIVKNLDSGNALLDDALNLFEEGVALVKFCNGKLDSAEQRVKIVTEGTEQDFIK